MPRRAQPPAPHDATDSAPLQPSRLLRPRLMRRQHRTSFLQPVSPAAAAHSSACPRSTVLPRWARRRAPSRWATYHAAAQKLGARPSRAQTPRATRHLLPCCAQPRTGAGPRPSSGGWRATARCRWVRAAPSQARRDSRTRRWSTFSSPVEKHTQIASEEKSLVSMCKAKYKATTEQGGKGRERWKGARTRTTEVCWKR